MLVDRSHGPLVGRESDLAGLLSIVRADGTRMVLLSGDAGVGKTRLMNEAVHRLAGEGWRGLVGHCLDFGDAAMPYLPFAEMLGGASADSPSLAQQVATGHPALARLAPGVFENGAVPGEEPERAEVFEAMHAVLDELAADSPLLVVVEDAHWADTSTRDLLSFLLSRRFAGRVVFLVTYRSDEMHRRHPLRARAAEWVRLPGVQRVQLEPLAPAAVRTLVEELIGSYGEKYDADVRRIVQRAQGNAFYAEELVGAFLGGGLPEELADLMLVRLDRLDDDARTVVRIASVSGQRVSHDLLAAVAPFAADELDRALRTALEAHVLVRTGESEYAFRHALLGEAVYDDLLPGERMRLHTAYADAVRQLQPEAGAADLARHALASHDLPTALVACIQAGERALATGGPEEAARHFTRALEVYDRAAPQLDDPPDEADLVIRAGEALAAAGRPETATALVEQYLHRLPPDTAPLDRARLLLAKVEAMRQTEFETPPSPISQEALDLVGPEPTSLRARILATHALMLVNDDRLDEARAVADEALELADRLGLPRLTADVGMTLTWLNQDIDAGESSRVELKRIIAESQSRGDVTSELRGFIRLGNLEYDYGALTPARAAFAQAAALARSSGRPWSIHGVAGRTLSAVVATLQGEWDEALRIVDFGREYPPPTARAMLESVRLAVAAGRGETGALDRFPLLRERWHREGLVAVIGGGAAIELLGRRDGAAAAVATYDDTCAVLSSLWGPDFAARLRLGVLALAAVADEAPRTPTAARDELRGVADRLEDEAGRAVSARREHGLSFSLEGRAWEARLSAERLRTEWLLGADVELPRLVDSWTRTLERFAELGHVGEEARAQLRLATVLRAAGRVEEASTLTAAARRTARRLGAAPILEELGQARSATSTELTPREQEILALVATGRSNGDIGRQLFISTKTVSVHVSNVMGKLGASSRTEAAALARQAGILR